MIVNSTHYTPLYPSQKGIKGYNTTMSQGGAMRTEMTADYYINSIITQKFFLSSFLTNFALCPCYNSNRNWPEGRKCDVRNANCVLEDRKRLEPRGVGTASRLQRQNCVLVRTGAAEAIHGHASSPCRRVWHDHRLFADRGNTAVWLIGNIGRSAHNDSNRSLNPVPKHYIGIIYRQPGWAGEFLRCGLSLGFEVRPSGFSVVAPIQTLAASGAICNKFSFQKFLTPGTAIVAIILGPTWEDE